MLVLIKERAVQKQQQKKNLRICLCYKIFLLCAKYIISYIFIEKNVYHLRSANARLAIIQFWTLLRLCSVATAMMTSMFPTTTTIIMIVITMASTTISAVLKIIIDINKLFFVI